MEKMKPFNPMPETLDDTKINPNDMLGPNKTDTFEQEGVFGDPDVRPTITRQREIDDIVRQRLTDDVLNKEILNEKIRQDVAASKTSPTQKEARTPREFLKLLIAKGEYKEDIDIFGQTWTIRALNQGDIIEAFNDIKDWASTTEGKINTILLSQIAFSIEAMNGVSVYEWFSDVVQRSEFSTTEEYKLAIRRVLRRYLEQMSNDVIKQFDNAYAIVESKRNEALAELKKS